MTSQTKVLSAALSCCCRCRAEFRSRLTSIVHPRLAVVAGHVDADVDEKGTPCGSRELRHTMAYCCVCGMCIDDL